MPQLPAQAVRTYRISAPLSTHWQPATCEQVDCPNHLNGWRTIVPADSPQADYIRHDRTRGHTETRDGGLAVFTFAAGQTCFATHKRRLDRDERFLIRGGDWRGNPRGEPTRELTAEQWRDNFGEHQETLADRIKQG